MNELQAFLAAVRLHLLQGDGVLSSAHLAAALPLPALVYSSTLLVGR
jgi:hypothetical protein